jgi:hypothetical protein
MAEVPASAAILFSEPVVAFAVAVARVPVEALPAVAAHVVAAAAGSVAAPGVPAAPAGFAWAVAGVSVAAAQDYPAFAVAVRICLRPTRRDW